MKQTFSAGVWQEDEWFVAQCVEADVASQGRTAEEALANLRDALELHFTPPAATVAPQCEPSRSRLERRDEARRANI